MPWIADRTPHRPDTLFGPGYVEPKVFPLCVHVDLEKGVRYGQIEAYICEACGFTEMYTVDPKKIPVSKIPGARVLEGTPTGTYR